MNITKPKGLVAAVSLALASASGLAVASTPDTPASFNASEAQHLQSGYLIELKGKGAFEAPAAQRKSATKVIINTQDSLISLAKSVDANASVESKVRLVGNHMTINMTAAAADKLAQDPAVASVTKINITSLPKRVTGSQQMAKSQSVTSMNKMADPNDGAGIRVAIIGTGIDYTHSMLGGAGTQEAYDEAWLNAQNEFEGFPTSVVTAGRDFSTEAGWGLDDNPIDTNLVYQREYGDFAWYPTGQGTMLAGIVHEIAPAAELIAVKVTNLSPNDWGGMNFSMQNQSTVEAAVEWLIDPDGDGDTSDKLADVVVLQSTGSALGLYDPDSESPDGNINMQRLLQVMSSQGMLVVTDTGSTPIGSTKYNLSYDSATPEVLGVNSIGMSEDGSYFTTEMTAHGPVRSNTDVVKPELSSVASATVPAVGSGVETTTRTNGDVAAARVAGEAAVLMSKRPELSAVEVKALLMNTANSSVTEVEGGADMAELTHIGHGVANMAAAQASPVVMWEERTYHASVNFGNQEVAKEMRLVREIRVKNLSDSAQTYQVSVNTNNEMKAGQSALSWNVPAEINVPANGAVVVPVVLTISGEALVNWPMKEGETYTIENWKQTEFNGYINFSSNANPDINVGWMVKARPSTSITKNFDTMVEAFSGGPGASIYPNGANHFSQEFTNDSNTETEFVVMPIVHRVEDIPVTKQGVDGVNLKMLGATLAPEPACTSGQKFMMGVSYDAPVDVSTANFFDRHEDQVYVIGFRESTVEAYGLADGFNGAYTTDEENAFIFHFFINEEGQPTAYYLDLNKVYDWNDPYGRYTASILPTKFTPNGRNVLAQFCTDELEHHDFTVDEFNSNIGIFAETDRFSLIEQGEPLPMFNPTFGGAVTVETVRDWFGNEFEVETHKGNTVGFSNASAEEVETATDFTNMVTLQPGERARLHVNTDGYCWGSCGKGFMLFSTDDNYALWAPTGYDGAGNNVIGIVKEGQSFDVVETAVSNGDIIGRVELDSEGFFAIYQPESQWSPSEFTILNSIPGNPVSIDSYGDITVINADAFDYETLETLRLMVSHSQSGSKSRGIEVVINVLNGNDHAPESNGDIGLMTLSKGEHVSVDVRPYFAADIDGDILSYSVDGLPAGMTFADGMITGSTQDLGTYSITVTATDGIYSATSNATFEIIEAVEYGSGSLPLWALFVLAGLGRLRRSK